MFNVAAFLETLPIMGKGLVGIFAVAVAIIFTVWLLNRLTSRKSDE